MKPYCIVRKRDKAKVKDILQTEGHRLLDEDDILIEDWDLGLPEEVIKIQVMTPHKLVEIRNKLLSEGIQTYELNLVLG